MEQTSSRHRANIKQAWWNSASWLKCRPQPTADHVLYRLSNYKPPALLISLLITIVRRASWMNISKHRANVEQLARVFWIHLLDVCSMFARSCSLNGVLVFWRTEQAVMHYSRHRLTASLTTWLRARTGQPMTNGLALLAHWPVRQKLNRVSSVHLRRSVRALSSLCCFAVVSPI